MEESSSDSDDYYGSVTQKLQLMKNKYNDGRYEVNGKEKVSNTSSIVIDDEDKCLDDSEETILDTIIAQNKKKPITRSKKNVQVQKCETLPKRTSKRRTKAVDEFKEPKSSTKIPETLVSRRGRGARRKETLSNGGQGKRRVRNSMPSNSIDPNIPTYSIGNTHEYPDHSHDQQLFNSHPTEIIYIRDEIDLSDNEELSVKVYWQSSKIVKFSIRKYQKLTQIYDYFAKQENVSYNNLVFIYNDKILRSEDTPDSIKYNIVKFIEGGITNENVSNLVLKKKKSQIGIRLKFRFENIKKPFEVIVEPNTKLSNAMAQCAEYFERPQQKLKFIFDGETLSGTSTPKDLELEGGECIDVKMMK